MLSGMALLLLLVAFSFSTPALSASKSSDRVILLVIDALSVDDFVSPEWTNLRSLAANGVIGLMNSRTASTPSSTIPAAAHATIGAGTRTPAGIWSGYAFDVADRVNGTPARKLYAATTGNKSPTTGVVFLGLPQLRVAAAGQPEGARPGALGGAIAGLGKRVAIVGNSDIPDPEADLIAADGPTSNAASDGPVPHRYGVLIAMDEHGHVPLGNVGPGLLTFDPDWPFGWRTDYDALWHAFTLYCESAHLIVVEFGDFARLDALAEWIDPQRMPALRRETIRRLDDWLARLVLWPPAEGASVGLVSPSPPAPALRANFLLTPVLWTRLVSDPAHRDSSSNQPPDNSSVVGPSLATSRTTRRAGIIANTDITPMTLALLSQKPTTVFPIRPAQPRQLQRDLPPTVAAPTDPWQAIALLYARATATHSLRAPVVRAFISSAIAVFVTWVAWIVYLNLARVPATPPRGVRIWRILMLLLSAAPLAMLLHPLLSLGRLLDPATDRIEAAPALSILLLTAAIALLAHVTGKARTAPVGGNATSASTGGNAAPANAFVGISLVTALAIVLDAWAGSPLMKSSVLGYDPIVGARYYGIGNEYMGVLIGTTLVGTTGLLDLVQNRAETAQTSSGTRSSTVEIRRDAFGLSLVLVAFLVVCATLSSPALGANVGGTIAAVVGFGLAAALLLGKQLTWRTTVTVGVACAAVLAAAAGLDLLRGPERLSHLGQTVLLVFRQGPGPLVDIIARKLAMNAKLLRWTIWAQVFIVSLGVSALALYRPSKTVQRIARHHPQLLNGIRGAVIAALVALAANDSGVVAAATMMIPVTAALMYLVLLQTVSGEYMAHSDTTL